jgi:hypothetical protein
MLSAALNRLSFNPIPSDGTEKMIEPAHRTPHR